MRKKPYTGIGITRVPCLKCGRPSSYQWQICSLGNLYAGICLKHDIELNKLVLKFIGLKNKEDIIKKYIKKQRVAKVEESEKDD